MPVAAAAGIVTPALSVPLLRALTFFSDLVASTMSRASRLASAESSTVALTLLSVLRVLLTLILKVAFEPAWACDGPERLTFAAAAPRATETRRRHAATAMLKMRTRDISRRNGCAGPFL